MDSELIPRDFATALASKCNKKKFLALDSTAVSAAGKINTFLVLNMKLIY